MPTRSYYRLKKDLIDLIRQTISAPLSYDRSLELIRMLDGQRVEMAVQGFGDLCEMAKRFHDCLDDKDIRDRDREYDEITTSRLRKWCEDELQWYSPDS